MNTYFAALAVAMAVLTGFAGEAVAQDLAQTCGGAFLSGQQAAQQILQRRA